MNYSASRDLDITIDFQKLAAVNACVQGILNEAWRHAGRWSKLSIASFDYPKDHSIDSVFDFSPIFTVNPNHLKVLRIVMHKSELILPDFYEHLIPSRSPLERICILAKRVEMDLLNAVGNWSHLRFLHVYGNNVPSGFIAASSTLEAFFLTFGHLDPSLCRSITFPRLHTIHIRILGDVTAITHWNLPKLRCLCFFSDLRGREKFSPMLCPNVKEVSCFLNRLQYIAPLLQGDQKLAIYDGILRTQVLSPAVLPIRGIRRLMFHSFKRPSVMWTYLTRLPEVESLELVHCQASSPTDPDPVQDLLCEIQSGKFRLPRLSSIVIKNFGSVAVGFDLSELQPSVVALCQIVKVEGAPLGLWDNVMNDWELLPRMHGEIKFVDEGPCSGVC